MVLDSPVTMLPSPPPSSGWWGGVTSALFWLLLLTAAALYAAVALAPKVVQWQRWQQVYVAQRYQLLEHEHQLESLQRLVDALDQDPQFVAELVRLELDATSVGEEIIPVDDSLTLDPRAVPNLPTATLPLHAPDPWEPWMFVLATQDSLRTGLLVAAATLVIAAFTFLHDGSETQRALRENQPESVLTVWEFCRRRYFTAPPTVSVEAVCSRDLMEEEATTVEPDPLPVMAE